MSQWEARASNRLYLFGMLGAHPLRAREMKAFNRQERSYAEELIYTHRDLDKNQWVMFLHRLVIDDPRVRNSQRTKLWGCLLEAATAEPKVEV